MVRREWWAEGLCGRTGEETDKVVNSHLAPPIVNLDLFVVDIQLVVVVVEDCGRELVAGVASHVVGQHHYDVVVGYPQPLDNMIDGEHVGHMPVVEPEG